VKADLHVRVVKVIEMVPLYIMASTFSEFSGSKEGCPDLPLGNGDMAGAIELKRPVGTHCHGKKAACDDSREKLIAKKKLYIASIVCLVFMIGEVIGKNRVSFKETYGFIKC